MKRYYFIWPCYLFISTVYQVFCENILVIHPVYAGSHILAVRRIVEELASKHHTIEIIRWAEENDIPPVDTSNVSEIILSVNNSDSLVPFMTKEEMARFQFPSEYMWHHGLNPTAVFAGGMWTAAAACKAMLQNEALIQSLKEKQFKVAIVDMIYNECGLALAHHLVLPVVGYWGLFFISGETQYTTAFNPPSLNPHLYTGFSSRMNFMERLVNTVYGVCSHIILQMWFYIANYHIRRHLANCPDPSTLIANISGMMINSHSSFDYAKQLPPSFFYIGGFHIKEPQPLDDELRRFIDSAEHGVILMTFGFNFGFENIPSEVYERFFMAFSKLKQKVILRSKGIPPKVPANVKILPFVRQSDILAHPKTVLFITHCGMHSIMEAIHYGVKMVGIPIYFDQLNVARRMEERGVAAILTKTATEPQISAAISKVLTDNRYEKNMKLLSKLYRSSFEPSLKRAVWLVEHVIEFEGANHLKVTSDLNFFQYFCIDVFLFVFLCAFILFYLTIRFPIYLCHKYRRSLLSSKLKSQ